MWNYDRNRNLCYNLMPTTIPICGVKSKHSRLKPIAFPMNVAEATLAKTGKPSIYGVYEIHFLVPHILIISFIFCLGMNIKKMISHQWPLSIMYDILTQSLPSSTADIIILCTHKEMLYLIHDSHSPIPREMLLVFACWFGATLSHLTC
jgi:hypothetical protein